jgi:hypothetical protein
MQESGMSAVIQDICNQAGIIRSHFAYCTTCLIITIFLILLAS